MTTREQRRSNLPADRQEKIARLDAEMKEVRIVKRAAFKGTTAEQEREKTEQRRLRREKRKAKLERKRAARQPKPAPIRGPSTETKDAFYRSWDWRTLRMEVLKEFGPECMCCGARAGNGVVIHVDHIKPLHTHWQLRLERSNLQVLCDACNQGKGAWDTTDYRFRKHDVEAAHEMLDAEFKSIIN